MHRYKNIAFAGLAGLFLFALGLSDIRAGDEEPEAWLSEYNEAMQGGAEPQ